MATLYDKWQQGERRGDGHSKTVDGDGGGGSGGRDSAGGEVGEATRLPSRLAQEFKEEEEEDKGDTVMFSYAVLTTSAAPRLQWLHERSGRLVVRFRVQRKTIRTSLLRLNAYRAPSFCSVQSVNRDILELCRAECRVLLCLQSFFFKFTVDWCVQVSTTHTAISFFCACLTVLLYYVPSRYNIPAP